ncbi:MAG: tetratricopeptide repeat protein [Treponema sp.]|jgi:tetratricopeptide (TPR) repeat protein|nr:tetratricopeptide repeat protein [Treponema sp.]
MLKVMFCKNRVTGLTAPVKCFCAVLLVLGYGEALFAQSAFIKGEALFLRDKPEEALPYLQTAAAEEPGNLQAFLYWGLACLQLRRVDEAISVYLQVFPRGGAEQYRIAYNLGNAYFTKEAYSQALDYYVKAIEANPRLAPAYLNRANTKIRLGDLRGALADYTQYLALEPQSPQRTQIESLVALINGEFAVEENRRLQSEAEAETERRIQAEAEHRRQVEAEVERRLQTEAERQRQMEAEVERRLQVEVERQRQMEAEVERRVQAERDRWLQAEADRRRQLLEEVTASLQSVAEEITGLSAGTEDVSTYDGEFELE